MSAPSDLNARIALVRGWTWHEEPQRVERRLLTPLSRPCDSYIESDHEFHWRNSHGYVEELPDWVNTLWGMAVLMGELMGVGWVWQKEHGLKGGFTCFNRLRLSPILEDTSPEQFYSPDDKPAHCVGEAWLYQHGA